MARCLGLPGSLLDWWRGGHTGVGSRASRGGRGQRHSRECRQARISLREVVYVRGEVSHFASSRECHVCIYATVGDLASTQVLECCRL